MHAERQQHSRSREEGIWKDLGEERYGYVSMYLSGRWRWKHEAQSNGTASAPDPPRTMTAILSLTPANSAV
ncbi:MAG TPA: hypothetical protein DEF07_00515 [Nitrosomonas sp.]|nr:hypothetical protein [Nitrosomonas sp.]